MKPNEDWSKRTKKQSKWNVIEWACQIDYDQKLPKMKKNYLMKHISATKKDETWSKTIKTTKDDQVQWGASLK